MGFIFRCQSGKHPLGFPVVPGHHFLPQGVTKMNSRHIKKGFVTLWLVHSETKAPGSSTRPRRLKWIRGFSLNLPGEAASTTHADPWRRPSHPSPPAVGSFRNRNQVPGKGHDSSPFKQCVLASK